MYLLMYVYETVFRSLKVESNNPNMNSKSNMTKIKVFGVLPVH